MLNHTETKKKSNLLNVYKRFPVSFTHGFGTKLYDEDGKEYTDFLSGIGVNAFGHNNLVIKEFVREQLDKYWHVSNLFEIELQEELANKLFSYSGLSNVFFSNSGTEANEAAIKFARLWGKGRFEIITAIDSFHGRTFGSLSATGQFNLWKDFKPILPGFKYVTFNDIDAIKNNITENSVAVMLEVIQGEGGINIPDENYLLEVEKICRENDLLLIIDEIQSGMGRTGKMFAYEHYGVKPDIVTLAKAVANGFPLGVTMCTNQVADSVFPGSHGSTFGGNPVSVAAALGVLSLLSDDVLKNNSDMGEYLKDQLKSLNSKVISDIRGKGLMIGIELNGQIDVSGLCSKLLEKGFITCPAKNNVLRLLPPYIITKNEITAFIKELDTIIN